MSEAQRRVANGTIAISLGHAHLRLLDQLVNRLQAVRSRQGARGPRPVSRTEAMRQALEVFSKHLDGVDGACVKAEAASCPREANAFVGVG